MERKQSLPAYRLIQHRKLANGIALLTEEIQGLQTEQKWLLEKLNCKSVAELKKYDGYTSKVEAAMQRLREHENQHGTEIHKALAEFDKVRNGVDLADEMNLIDKRLAIRPQKEQEFTEYIKACETEANPQLLDRVQHDTDNRLLHEDLEFDKRSLLWKLKHMSARQQQRKQHMPKRRSRDDWDLEL